MNEERKQQQLIFETKMSNINSRHYLYSPSIDSVSSLLPMSKTTQQYHVSLSQIAQLNILKKFKKSD